jgi:hypothetical protein
MAWRLGPRAHGNAREAHGRAGAVTRSTVARWGLADGKVLPASTGGVSGWRQAGGVEAGLTLAVVQREGSERWRRRRGGGRRRGREGSGERRGGPVAHGGGEGGGCGAVSERRGGDHGVGGRISTDGGGVPFLKKASGRRNGGGRVMWLTRGGSGVRVGGSLSTGGRRPIDSGLKTVGAGDMHRACTAGRTEGEGRS